ncbi:2-amino-4-hydroxy-6-hydroxymethyldihydropteridinediphosphokinase/dihydroneopterin aldolase / 2-amino-4-hydroxy-6-hydroxymethyldihydropteridine diphosphokinase [Lishizhenia tianjinensis]|uniref:2-amino-4-hydroxy-6-hydroxymethyldihydropteridine pyrophosphokinase n=1 Tax=Lishizhenia tianjinensis TaxID=477690 RepID=A0A1I7BQ63_9FLAO|nr:2-amino-4-hydroxy-6-hydroxymethyldihydropteridine diphosphokinase [Lishizhenia tianjinensis]SFT89327.1 2-amino-4-hydroxy-6-hydroxymethyldihydropteridinediphosphokinase/dihydroneopterin aldolase / 2-amino-4-hydroxy-6-hydroxymethyldihydropteridine diphosphokinase [Lishizhenia tianjinensis]
MSVTVFLGLGGNHDNSEELLKIALRKIGELATKIVATSSFYQTPPWGFEADNDFINCVVEIEYTGHAEELLTAINALEAEMGRIRTGEGYASRPMDIDILYFGNQVITNDVLDIPHPRMYHRNFVMHPLHEIAPNWIDPLQNKTVKELFEKCEDDSEIIALS